MAVFFKRLIIIFSGAKTLLGSKIYDLTFYTFITLVVVAGGIDNVCFCFLKTNIPNST